MDQYVEIRKKVLPILKPYISVYINYSIIWDTINEDLPLLKRSIKRFFK